MARRVRSHPGTRQLRYRAEQSRTSVRNEIFDYGSAAAHSHFPYVSGVDYVELTLQRRRWSRP